MKIFGRNKNDKAGPSEKMEEILSILLRLARSEQRIAEFYHRCAELLPEEKAFWEELAFSEHRHSATIHRLHDMIEEQPDRFRPGQKIDLASVRVFEVFVRDLLDNTDLESLSRKELVNHAIEIENSAVELNYHRMVTSRVPEYTRLASEIDEDTRDHLRMIQDRLASS